PCPNLAASTAAYRRRSFSDSHPKNRCIFCSISAEYPSMPHSLIQNLLRGQDTTAQAIREVILDHILSAAHRNCPARCCARLIAPPVWRGESFVFRGWSTRSCQSEQPSNPFRT